MDSFIQDMKYGVRTLARAPGYFLVAVLSLALGIGANVAVFTVGNALLFRPMDVPAGRDIIRVYYDHHSPFSYPDYADLRDGARNVVDLAAMRPLEVGIGENEAQRKVVAEAVTGNYFSALGFQFGNGRQFTAEESSPNGIHRVAIISRVVFDRDYGGTDMSGKTITVNGERYEIVGVAPDGFRGTMFGRDVSIWLPISDAGRLSGMDLTRRDRGGGLYALGRLTGASANSAHAALRVIANRLSKEFPAVHSEISISIDRARGVPAEVWRQIAVVTSGLMLLVSFVLLIACANVVNIALARATVRRRELAVRLAIGATRSRVVRQLLMESALIAGASVLVGLVMASAIVHLVGQMLPADFPLKSVDFVADERVVVFAALAGLAAMVFCGLVPALLSSRPDLVPALREAAGADRRHTRLRGALVIAQVVMCTVLLVGSGLFVRSLGHASDLDPGFDTANVLDMPLDLRLLNMDESRGAAFYDHMLGRLRETPGIEAVSLARLTPLSFDNMGQSFDIEGKPRADGAPMAEAGFNIVAEDYFTVLGVQVLQGRAFAAQDAKTSPFVAVINETMARTYWPNENPVGQRFGANLWGKSAEVIGVVKDSKYTTLGEAPKPFMYLPLAQHFSTRIVVQLRVAGDPVSAIARVREVTHDVEPGLALPAITRLSDDVSVAFLPARVGAGLMGSLGLLALVLAIGGVYGVTAYSVAQRTREIGIRSALGGTTRDIVSFVLAGSLRQVAVGTTIGLVLALGMGKLLASFLYGVSPADPVTFALVPLGLALAAAIACLVPAHRAARIDPLIALRAE